LADDIHVISLKVKGSVYFTAKIAAATSIAETKYVFIIYFACFLSFILQQAWQKRSKQKVNLNPNCSPNTNPKAKSTNPKP